VPACWATYAPTESSLMGTHDLVDRYAQRIVDTPAARSALQTIVAAADNPAVAGQIAAGTLPPELDAA
jgi:hypothetical protein